MEKEKVITLIDAFKDFKEEKNIDRPVMMQVLKDVFLTQIAKTYGSSDNFDVIVNVDKGTCEIYQNFDVVEEVENPNAKITLDGIRADGGFKKYSEKVGELFYGEVYQTWSKEVLILDEDGNELHIPKSEQIPGERFKKSDSVRAVIKSVEMKNNTTPYITLSRVSNEFLERLFEQEVPEIADGLITVKKVVRVPGERAKVAVESYDDRIDNIDVIQWSQNPKLMIQRALNPAVVSYIEMGENPDDKVKVFMQPDQVSKGIGRHGVNIQLAGMLVDREIEVYRELPKGESSDEEDVLLSEFSDVIDQWIIDRLEAIGCDTAKGVLALSPEDIAKRADLEDETVEEVRNILKAEFED